ncbi:hypothetical protein OQJ26_17235 [Legionella sp. PATHC038]|uniref:hypothetical protein n=1 Tax=Legionella sheltonii TaxID=2992041 RepID=UPI0022437FC4|nr:hypothetical protein [Legionella sp. PATHC038]MCW8400525.1 hypothetical protein [Legionella sp. PATHC038]
MHYSAPMLPDVDYMKIFDDEEFEPFFSLVDLEYDTFKSCCDFLEEVKSVLLEEQLVQVPELLLAHLCAYLGTVITLHTVHDAENLEPLVINLITHQAHASYQHFNEYPINSAAKSHEQKIQNLEHLRQSTPGSILNQTMRLGRIMMDVLEELKNNQPIDRFLKPKQTELFCNQESLIKIALYLGSKQCASWRETLDGLSDNYVMNQLAIQIGWLIGYFSHLDHKAPDKTRYFDYGLPLTRLYRESVYKMMHAYVEAQNSESQKEDMEAEVLLSEIQSASEKVRAQVLPAITEFQKQMAIAKAGIEKALIELMNQGCAIKILLMSLFYFWFTLEAPLHMQNPEHTDKEDPFLHMGNIIELVKKTARTLPDPELSPEIQVLNQKMQQLKKYMPNPESLDTVPQEQVENEAAHVNTTIHTATSEYLKRDFHHEAVANALFSHWLRLSVFFGVPESYWQKMDYYFKEIMEATRQYLSMAFSDH